jgi:hypothetical protein
MAKIDQKMKKTSKNNNGVYQNDSQAKKNKLRRVNSRWNEES